MGELIVADRDRWVLATRYTVNQRSGDPNAGGNHRKSLKQASARKRSSSTTSAHWTWS